MPSEPLVPRFTQNIVSRPISSLRPYAGNARVHSKRQVQQIAASIQRFGFTNPVLVSGEGRSSPAMAAWRCGALSAFS